MDPGKQYIHQLSKEMQAKVTRLEAELQDRDDRIIGLNRIIAEQKNANAALGGYIVKIRSQWNETAKVLNSYMEQQEDAKEITEIYAGHPAR